MLIILFLNSSFNLYYISSIVRTDTFNIKNIIYSKDENSRESKGFLGFFDWLRLNESEIVGIRLCYFEDQPYNNILRSLPYVTSTFQDRCMEILFQGDNYNLELSGDQDFTNNFVYRSKTGDYLFTFGLDHLTEQEIVSLMQYCEVLKEFE